MGGTGAAFGGGQGAIAAALTLGLIQDVVHGGEHVPGWDAVHGECCGVVIGDKFPWGKWLSPQRVLACGGWRPSNIGRPKERHTRGPKQCGEVTGAGVVANNHGRILYGQQGRMQAVLTDHSRPGDVFGHRTQSGVFLGRSQKHDGMTGGLQLLSEVDKP